MVKLLKKTTKKDDREFTNLYLDVNGVKVPIEVKKFGKKKQDYFRYITVVENAEEVK